MYTQEAIKVIILSEPVFTYHPLNRVHHDILNYYLRDHPNRQLVEWAVQGFKVGFDLGLERAPKPNEPCRNAPRCYEHPEVVREMVAKEVALGHVVGPLDKKPWPDMVFSPLQLVPKVQKEFFFIL